jgi:glycosyltransferase involved in cell wall biosynthesis
MTSPDRAQVHPADTLPLVSVFMFVRNGAPTLRRAIDSVLRQTYSNIEFVVQDGASTDDTLEILRSYGDRLKVVSEPDNGPSDGLWRALNRCSGDFIGSCLADEELLPDAVERAVAVFLKEPEVGAITGDAMITDLSGRQTGLWTSGPFNLADYLMADYSPYFCASFFRRRALLDAGLKTDGWNPECIEFELWCRLATCSSIKYVPGIVAKYATHPDQSSNKPGDTVVHVRGRLNLIMAMCSDQGFLGPNPLLRTLFIWGLARRFCDHAIQINRPETAKAIYDLARQALDGLPKACLDGIEYDQDYELRRSAIAPGQSIAKSLIEGMKKPVVALSRRLVRDRSSGPTAHPEAAYLRFPPLPDERLKGRIYAMLALRYEEKQRLKDALGVWKQAAILNHLVDRAAIEGEALPPVGYTHIAD